MSNLRNQVMDKIADAWDRKQRIDHAADAVIALVLGDHTSALTARVAELEARQGDNLHAFIDAAASEGYILGGVDAADLYVSVFPERYAAALLAKGNAK